MGGRGDRGRKKLSKLQEEVEMAGAPEWVQRGELERPAALVPRGPSDLRGQWALRWQLALGFWSPRAGHSVGTGPHSFYKLRPTGTCHSFLLGKAGD